MSDEEDDVSWIRGLAAVGMGAVLLATGPAAAASSHTAPVVMVDSGCGQVDVGSSWSGEHQAPGARLVIQHLGFHRMHHVLPIGIEVRLTVRPGDRVRWRIWGGEVRGYDRPSLADRAALQAYVAAGGDPLGMDVPGVAWQPVTLNC